MALSGITALLARLGTATRYRGSRRAVLYPSTATGATLTPRPHTPMSAPAALPRKMHCVHDVATTPTMYAWSGAVSPANCAAAAPFRIASPRPPSPRNLYPVTTASAKCSSRTPKETATSPSTSPAWYCTVRPADGSANPSGWLDRGIGSCAAFALMVFAAESHIAVASSVPVRAAVGPAPALPTASTAVRLVMA
jgi:hypothetical protein